MQAIQTKYLPATNTKPSRIKAWADRGSITVSFQSAEYHGDPHKYAAALLVEKFIQEDEKQYGSTRTTNPWGWPMIQAGLPGDVGQVFVTGREMKAISLLKDLLATIEVHRWKTNSDEFNTIQNAKDFISTI